MGKKAEMRPEKQGLPTLPGGPSSSCVGCNIPGVSGLMVLLGRECHPGILPRNELYQSKHLEDTPSPN